MISKLECCDRRNHKQAAKRISKQDTRYQSAHIGALIRCQQLNKSIQNHWNHASKRHP